MFFSLTLIGERGRISTLYEGCIAPPSSSGLGRSPLKAETGVRFPLGAQNLKEPPTVNVERFFELIRFEGRDKLEEFPIDWGNLMRENPCPSI